MVAMKGKGGRVDVGHELKRVWLVEEVILYDFTTPHK